MEMALIRFITVLYSLTYAFCSNIVRHSCNTQAAFYKVASNYAMTDESKVTKSTSDGPFGCMDLCIELPTCKAFNVRKISSSSSTCELVQKDRTTNPKDVVARSGWIYYDTGLFSSQIGQFCSSLSYNPCYPCLCIDSCYSNLGYTCNCTEGKPSLPSVYLAFESNVDGDETKVPYSRGKDKLGNSIMTLNNGAAIAKVAERPGKILRIQGTDAGGRIGNFQSFPINNPGGSEYSVSLWLRIVSLQSHTQTVFGCGRRGAYTGTLLRVSGGQNIYAKVIISSKVVATPSYNLGDTLKSWTHVALAAKIGDSKVVKLYINGKIVAAATTTTSATSSTTDHPDLIVGAGSLYTLRGDSWDMQMDDFAIWHDHFLTTDDIIHIMSKGFV